MSAEGRRVREAVARKFGDADDPIPKGASIKHIKKNLNKISDKITNANID